MRGSSVSRSTTGALNSRSISGWVCLTTSGQLVVNGSGSACAIELPKTSDLRYNWVVARLAALDHDELTELVLDAWRMCVPKKVAAAYDG